MSIADQIRQQIQQKMQQRPGGGMPAPSGAPAGMPGGQGPFDFVPRRPQFQPVPIPPGLSPGAAGQAKFDRMPMSQRPAAIDPLAPPPAMPSGGSFADQVRMIADLKNRAQLQMNRQSFQDQTAPIRNRFADRRQMLMQRPSVGGFDYASLMGRGGGRISSQPFGYSNLNDYIMRMQMRG